MARPRYRRDSKELDKVLKKLTKKALRDKADEIRQATGRPGDYEIEERTGPTRFGVTIRTIDEWPARAREARDHLLIQALGATGGVVYENPDEL